MTLAPTTGFLIHDIVSVSKTFCAGVNCEKQRVHEVYQGWKYCVWCGLTTEFTDKDKSDEVYVPLKSLEHVKLDLEAFE